MIKKKTDRPTRYTEAQMIEGIALAESTGKTPSGDTVKKAMCDNLGLPDGINAQSLDREVHLLPKERTRQGRDRLVADPPSETLDAVRSIGSLVEDTVSTGMGEQHEKLCDFAGRKLAEVSEDLENQREQIRELLFQIDAMDAEIAELEREEYDLRYRLDLATDEVGSLRDRLASHDREGDLQARMLATMKETLDRQAKAAG